MKEALKQEQGGTKRPVESDYLSYTAYTRALEAYCDEQEQGKPVACWCHKCNKNELVNGVPFAMTRMILCPDCGNKRCPKASDHTLLCTNSNKPNQTGSVYTTPQPKQEQGEPFGYPNDNDSE